MGVDIAFVEPEAHFVIDNSFLENLIENQQKLQERVNIFLSGLTKIDDRVYWEKYYAIHHKIGESSLFAKTCMTNYFKKGQTLVELGCGNGRDSIYFAHNGIQVLGIDQCKNIIDFLQKHTNANLNFQCADFANLSVKVQYDIIYSRFTLHSITQKQQDKVILWAKESLKRGGIFAIEVRGYKNSLYKMGIPVEGEKDAFIFENHYRRFLNLEDLLRQLQDFNIIYAKEEKGFAPFKEEDDYFIRVIVRK
ncbi:MAG: methyltransferase domain-containing protein [Helicobacter sp.]|nr:methyltransferase domain-containing protein [Helicobacter sp.]